MRWSRPLALLSVLVLLATACSSDALEADAGPDQEIAVGDSPTFDGCESTGDIEAYSWVILEAPEGMADDAGKAIKLDHPDCSYTLDAAMGLEEVGPWRIELTVTDGSETSTDEVVVDVLDG